MAYSVLPVYNFTGQDAIAVFNTVSAQGYFGMGVKTFTFSQYIVLYTNGNSDVHVYRIIPNTQLSAELDTLFGSTSIYNDGWLCVSSAPFGYRRARAVCTGNPPTGVDSTIRDGDNSALIDSIVIRRNNAYYNMAYLPSGVNAEGQGFYVTGIYNLSGCSSWNDLDDIPIAAIYPITYYPTNVTLDPAPPEAAVGDIVTVGVSVPAGYSIRDPSSNIVVRNNGIIVPHTWDASTSQFIFEMPNPS